MTTDEMKRAAAEAAADLVENGMSIGLGSGSTAREFVRALGHRTNQGLSITAVASSEGTAEVARQLGIQLVELDRQLDLAIDGADAVARSSLDAVKGLGGALTRERIVAASAERFVLIVDETKLCDHLDNALADLPVPVAVVPFGWLATRERLSRYGQPSIRRVEDGSTYQTDDGNFIVDLHVDCPSHLEELAAQIKGLAGVVDHGLFLDLASTAIVGTADGGILTFERA